MAAKSMTEAIVKRGYTRALLLQDMKSALVKIFPDR